MKAGDKVRIKKSSPWYGVGCSKPKDIKGTIIMVKTCEFGTSIDTNVLWDTSTINGYNESDLEIVKEETFEKINRKPHLTSIDKYDSGKFKYLKAGDRVIYGDGLESTEIGTFIGYSSKGEYVVETMVGVCQWEYCKAIDEPVKEYTHSKLTELVVEILDELNEREEAIVNKEHLSKYVFNHINNRTK